MLSKDKIINIIERKRNKFKAIIDDCVTCSDPKGKKKKFYNALKFANNSDFGVYCSKEIEEYFCSLAKEIHIDLCENPKPNSILHIATRLYDTGGHSRVLERWIELSPENETHSVILIHNKKHVVPTQLKDAVAKKNGTIQELELSLSDMEKAKQLRKIASEYERVILHIHMDDVVPLIAFGTTEFKRPIFFLNHADHLFWVGSSIADTVIDLRQISLEFSQKYRATANNRLLPIPLDPKENNKEYNILKIKEKFSLPINKNIIFSGGQANKFTPLLDINFGTYIRDILKICPDSIFVLVGPKTELLFPHDNFEEISRIFSFQTLNYESYLQLLTCADLVVDSYPIGGGTLLIDAVQKNIPVLSYPCIFGQLDYIMQSPSFCSSYQELIIKSEKIITNCQYADKIQQETNNILHQSINTLNWYNELNKIYNEAREHQIHFFNTPELPNISYKEMYLYISHKKNRLKLKTLYLLNKIKHIISNKCQKG